MSSGVNEVCRNEQGLLSCAKRITSRNETDEEEHFLNIQTAFEEAFNLDLLSDANAFNSILLNKFGQHKKVLRNHLAMLQKAKTSSAQNFSANLLSANLADKDSRKIVLASKKCDLTAQEYVSELNKYLEDFPEDIEGWMELADTYERKQQFEKAIYCYEEILLIDPNRINLYQKLGELNYSVGKLENVILATKYFCFLLKINENSPRTIGCLRLAATALEGNKTEDFGRVKQIAEQLAKKYCNA